MALINALCLMALSRDEPHLCLGQPLRWPDRCAVGLTLVGTVISLIMWWSSAVESAG